MLNRRSFNKLAVLTAAGFAAVRNVTAEAVTNDSISYMDGYHGGVVGHMPPGSWRDILSALDEFPEWKISLDIEPDSWEVLRRDDPESFARLAALLAKGDRVEMVGGTYAQPYGWAVSGESNIRQLAIGLRVIREAFPALSVTVYAVQEPCWASCLPQILRSFGMTSASLKNASTAWGGYTAGFDADVVRWVGPDGSSVAAVPRYAMERVQQVWETESIDATPEFARRCREAGIERPAGMCFQDLGWTAKPRVQRPGLRHLTWSQYFAFAGTPKKDWHFTPEDILVTLPWGDSTLRTVAQQVRSAENRIIVAEKLAVLAKVQAGRSYPADDLDRAWRQLLLTQAHDAWITATTRAGREAWAFTVAQNTLDAETASEEIIRKSIDSIVLRSHAAVAAKKQQAIVFNSLASSRTDLVSLSVAADPGTTAFLLHDDQGHAIPIQTVTDRTYPALADLKDTSHVHSVEPGNSPSSNGITHATVLARVDIPAMGYRAFTIEPLSVGMPQAAVPGATVLEESDFVTIQTDLYALRLDRQRGGTIASLKMLPDGQELISGKETRRFGEYRGYFIEERAWRSTADQPAKITVRESGPIRVVVQIEAELASGHVTTLLTLVQGEPRIDIAVTLNFPSPTWVGAPVDVSPRDVRTQRKRSQNDGRWKLQVHHPFGSNGELYKSAAFDVCRSRNEDTSFEGWDNIRHNIIAQWIDLWQPSLGVGLAILSDCTTAYNYGPEQPLGLVLAWAWEGGFWWGKHALEGKQTQRYALLPHRHKWDEAGMWHQYQRYSEPLRGALSTAPADALPKPYSMVTASEPGLHLSAAELHEEGLHLRFFNAEAKQDRHTVKLGIQPVRIEQIELSGKVLHHVEVNKTGDGAEFSFELRRFGLATFRCVLH